ncbi:MAG: methyltransferase [Pseudomonadota bacterium]
MRAPAAADVAEDAQAEAGGIAVTEDVFLGGALTLRQPRQGYRAGLDAVLLAALAPVPDGGDKAVTAADLGSGVGTVGLAVAARCSVAAVDLVERNDALVRLATDNVRRNRPDGRARVIPCDIGTADAARLLSANHYDLALANPPFHAEHAARAPANALKRAAHIAEPGTLEVWARTMARIVRPGGEAVIIYPAGQLADVLSAFDGRFGGLCVLPVHAKANAPAIRCVVRGTKGSRAPLSIAPGLTLHSSDGSYCAPIEAAMRAPAALDAWPMVS